MDKTSEFLRIIGSSIPTVWMLTDEPERVIKEVSAKISSQFSTAVWDCANGLTVGSSVHGELRRPVEPLQWISGEYVATDGATMNVNPKTVLFLLNYHMFLTPPCSGEEIVGDPMLVQTILNKYDSWQDQNKVVVIVSPQLSIPPELIKAFYILHFPLPDKEERRTIIKEFIKNTVVDGADMVTSMEPLQEEQLVQASAGLTRRETENALAMSFVEHDALIPETVSMMKKQLVMRNSTVEITDYTETMDDLKGLANLKKFCLQVGTSPLSKGVLLVGVPGCGKSMTAKVLATALKVPGLRLDMGKLFGQYVGTSEKRTRDALAVIDAMAPCLVFIDEIEKAVGGIASSYQTDGGTGSRVFSTFLSWMQDHKSQVFVIASCNDITKIPPEFLRAERWDSIFFVDIPNEKERKELVEYYSTKFNIKADDIPPIDDWTGAEICSLFRLAHIMKVTPRESAQYVVPISKSMGPTIEELRKWAGANAIMASDSSGTKEVERKPTNYGMEVG